MLELGSAAWTWITDRRFELVLPIWALLFLVFIGNGGRAKHPQFYPLLLAFAWSVFGVTVLMWPDARWPTYRSGFYADILRYEGRAASPLELSLGQLFLNPGYALCGGLALYATVAAFGRTVKFPRPWGYAMLVAFLLANELFVHVIDF